MAARFFASLYRCSIGTAATAFFFALVTLLLSGIPVYAWASAIAAQMMLLAAPALLYSVGYSRGPKLKYFVLCIVGGIAVSLLGLELLLGLLLIDNQADTSAAGAWLRFGLWALALACLIPVMIGMWRRSEEDERSGGWVMPLIQWAVCTFAIAAAGPVAVPIWVGGIVGYWIEHRSDPGQRIAVLAVGFVVTLGAVATGLLPRGSGIAHSVIPIWAQFLVPLSLLVPLTAWAMPRWRARFGEAGGA